MLHRETRYAGRWRVKQSESWSNARVAAEDAVPFSEYTCALSARRMLRDISIVQSIGGVKASAQDAWLKQSLVSDHVHIFDCSHR